MIELICGSINDVDIRMASLNNGVTTTAALISLLSTYVKTKKRQLENSEIPTVPKRPKFFDVRRCFNCNLSGHVQSQCTNKSVQVTSPRVFNQTSKFNDYRLTTCTFCKKVGHNEAVCFHKERAEANKISTVASPPITKGINFLDRRK